jgi:hypothetical protein
MKLKEIDSGIALDYAEELACCFSGLLFINVHFYAIHTDKRKQEIVLQGCKS